MKIFEYEKKEDRVRIYFFGFRIFTFRTKHNKSIKKMNLRKLSVRKKMQKEINSNGVSLAIIYSIYFQHDNFEEIRNRIKYYESLPEELKSRFEIILVDDASYFPVSLPETNLNISLLRIEKDIPWNSCGARNLGACYSDSKKCIFIDFDWVVPEETLRYCLDNKFLDDEMIIFDREVSYEGARRETGVIPNIYAMTKKGYLNVNGYDEDFAGLYGDDIYFRQYIIEKGIKFIRSDQKILDVSNYDREHNLERDSSEARVMAEEKKEHSKMILRFPWRFVEKREYAEK